MKYYSGLSGDYSMLVEKTVRVKLGESRPGCQSIKFMSPVQKKFQIKNFVKPLRILEGPDFFRMVPFLVCYLDKQSLLLDIRS